MRRLFVPLVAAAMSVLVIACSQAAPATPAPTAPPATSQAAAATNAPATSPTQEVAGAQSTPSGQGAWPAQGRTISLVVPYAAGGSTDVSARFIAPEVEKVLGTPVQVVNRPGGGSQVGNTEVATARPDGYTAGYPAWPTIITSYLDPARQAAYTRSSFAPVARTTVNTVVFVVRADSPLRDMSDMVDAGRANPEQIKVASSGLMSVNHLPVLMLENLTGADFAEVHFDGSAPGLTALLGGHVDVASALEPEIVGQVQAGEMRVLGVADTEESALLPGAQTMAAQGYEISMQSTHGVTLPASAPQEAVDTLSAAIGEAMENPS